MNTPRWTLTSPATGESWTMEINPNQMTSPHPQQNLTLTRRPRGFRQATLRQPPQITNWEWGGVIHTKEQYDALLSWAKADSEVHVTDHLGRTFEVVIQSFQPEDRTPTKTKTWRLNYMIRALILRRVS